MAQKLYDKASKAIASKISHFRLETDSLSVFLPGSQSLYRHTIVFKVISATRIQFYIYSQLLRSHPSLSAFDYECISTLNSGSEVGYFIRCRPEDKSEFVFSALLLCDRTWTAEQLATCLVSTLGKVDKAYKLLAKQLTIEISGFMTLRPIRSESAVSGPEDTTVRGLPISEVFTALIAVMTERRLKPVQVENNSFWCHGKDESHFVHVSIIDGIGITVKIGVGMVEFQSLPEAYIMEVAAKLTQMCTLSSCQLKNGLLRISHTILLTDIATLQICTSVFLSTLIQLEAEGEMCERKCALALQVAKTSIDPSPESTNCITFTVSYGSEAAFNTAHRMMQDFMRVANAGDLIFPVEKHLEMEFQVADDYELLATALQHHPTQVLASLDQLLYLFTDYEIPELEKCLFITQNKEAKLVPLNVTRRLKPEEDLNVVKSSIVLRMWNRSQTVENLSIADCPEQLILNPAFLKTNDFLGSSPVSIYPVTPEVHLCRRALNEHLKTWHSLSHPQVATIYGIVFSPETKRFSVVTERLESLRDYMKGYRTVADVCTVFRQVGSALLYLHSKSVLHLNLTPDTVFVQTHGTSLCAKLGRPVMFLSGLLWTELEDQFSAPELVQLKREVKCEKSDSMEEQKSAQRFDAYSYAKLILNYWEQLSQNVKYPKLSEFKQRLDMCPTQHLSVTEILNSVMCLDGIDVQ